MLLKSWWLPKQWLLGGLILSGVSCMTPHSAEAQTARTVNQQMDRMEKMDGELARREKPSSMMRSQSPTERPVLAPISPISPTSASTKIKTESQVRIVANVGNATVYESEVREAVNQRMGEFSGLTATERLTKEEALFYEELRRIIERELILEEMFAKLKSNKAKANVLDELEEAAKKESERQVKDFRSRIKVPTEEEFILVMQGQGVSIPGLRRQLERNFMMRMYLRELLSTKVNNVSLSEIRDYYDEHRSEFQTEDRVKWQDIFISANKYPSRQEARRVAESLLQRARRGEDFMELAKQFDQGLARGVGEGEQRGQIRPLEAENMVFALKAGEVAWIEMETGYHIIRVAEKMLAGRKPLDDKTQTEIRRKLQGIVSDREYARIIETLWRRNPPQIFVGK